MVEWDRVKHVLRSKEAPHGKESEENSKRQKKILNICFQKKPEHIVRAFLCP